MRLSPYQIALQQKTSFKPRKTTKFCPTCHGTHAGSCNLVPTSHGTHCRADIVEQVERRFRERNTR